MFGRKNLYEEIARTSQTYPQLAGLPEEIRLASGNAPKIMGTFRTRFSRFTKKQLEDFISRYDGQVNVYEAKAMVGVAKEIYKTK